MMTIDLFPTIAAWVGARLPQHTIDGLDGQPAQDEQRKIEKAELYDLNGDIGEAVDVASQHADIVQHLQALAETAREELGDSLTNRIGKGVRPPPQVPLSDTGTR